MEDFEFEDEDMELQAALQASLMDDGAGPGSHTPSSQPSHPPSPPHDPVDPVAASMARNRLIMEHMRRHQEIALQEQYEEEAARVAHATASADASTASDDAGGPTTRRRRRRGEDEEDEMLRRAILESQLLAGETTGSQPTQPQNQTRARAQETSSTVEVITNPHAPLMEDGDSEEDDADFVDAEMDVEVDSDDDDERYRLHPAIRPTAPDQAPAPLLPLGAELGLGRMQPLPYPNHRVYDDDDAELQAALKASLENVPEGFRIPSTPPPAAQPAPSSFVPIQSQSGATPSSSAPRRGAADDDGVASEADTNTSVEAPVEQSVDVDEMRRRRLARFGG